MTIDSSIRRAGPFKGNGSSVQFPFEFKVFERSDVLVTLADSDNAETVLQLDADYEVTLNDNQDQAPGGVVSYPISGAPMPTGFRLTISGNVPYAQPTSITNQGGFYPKVLEDALDRAVIQIQQLAEQLSRSFQAPISGGATVEELLRKLEAQLALVESVYDQLSNIEAVANNEANINTTASNVGAVVSVAGDLGGTWRSGVAYDFGFVTDPPVGNTSPPGGNIVVVANNIDDVNTVAGNITTINDVGQSIVSVNSVAANIPAVLAVENNEANINAAVANAANISSVADNETNINAAVANEDNINAVVANQNNIDAVAANETNINAAVANQPNIDTVANDIDNINTVSAHHADIQTVAGIASEVVIVAENETVVEAVGRDLNGQPIVLDYGDLTPAKNPATPSGVLGAVWTNAANIAAVAGEIPAVIYVSQHLTDILAALSGALVPINNLSDLDDPATARANLGLADLGGIN